MRILAEAAALAEEIGLVADLTERIELRAARLLAALLKGEVPEARYVQIGHNDEELSLGPVMNGDGTVLSEGVGDLDSADDLYWLVGMFTPGGAWETAAVRQADGPWLDLDQAVKIGFEE